MWLFKPQLATNFQPLHPSTASTSILSHYTHPQLLRYLHTQPLHLSSEPLHPSSVSTFSFSLHAHPQPLQPQPSQPQPLHPQPLHPSSASTSSFSLILYINFRAYFRSYIPSYTYLWTNVMSSLPQFSCIFSPIYLSLKHLFVYQCTVVFASIFVHIFARISLTKTLLCSLS